MVTFLRKVFIKDYKNVEDEKVREKHGILAACGGIFMNLILFTIKLIVGLLAMSLSIISDAINNLTDLFSCFVNLFGFKMAGKKADAEHPYGHERIEYIAGMIISFIIIMVAIVLGYTSITKLIAGPAEISYSIYSFIVLGVGIVFKILLGLFYRGLGNAIDSITLKASMQDSINDAISTFCVLVAAIVQFYFTDLWWLDAAMSLIVAVFICYSGIKLTLDTAQPLIGISPDSEMVTKVCDEIKSYKGVLGIHDVVCHMYGPTKVFMTVHVEVDGYKNIFDSHDMVDAIEGDIRKKYNIDLTIHMDPIDTKNKDIPILKEMIREILDKYDTRLMFHDVRVVKGPTHTNIVFDLVVPYNFETSDDALIKKVKREIHKKDVKYFAVIKVDHSFVEN